MSPLGLALQSLIFSVVHQSSLPTIEERTAKVEEEITNMIAGAILQVEKARADAINLMRANR